MNKITVHNYEAFLLDLSEGNLSGEDRLELEVFMIEHPELAVDMEDFSFAVTTAEPIAFTHKETIKKTASDLVSGDEFIAYIEQQLSAEDALALEKSCVVNPALARELELYKATVAKADLSIVFADKQGLKRKPKVIWFNFSAGQFAAAASIALLILLYVLWPTKPQEVTPNKYANNTLIKTPVSSKKNNTSVISTTNEAIPEKQLPEQHSTIQQEHLNQPANPNFVANNTPGSDLNTNHTPLTNSVIPDTISHIAVNKDPVIVPEKEPVLVASANHKTVVDVITERDDDPTTNTQKKQGFWALAGKTLKGLNKAGVKSVNGEEETTKQDASYALTLGGLSITHKAH
ncbi:MAG: hypothetical protein V4506_05030 [Bacteroidota bacterium]